MSSILAIASPLPANKTATSHTSTDIESSLLASTHCNYCKYNSPTRSPICEFCKRPFSESRDPQQRYDQNADERIEEASESFQEAEIKVEVNENKETASTQRETDSDVTEIPDEVNNNRQTEQTTVSVTGEGSGTRGTTSIFHVVRLIIDINIRME